MGFIKHISRSVILVCAGLTAAAQVHAGLVVTTTAGNTDPTVAAGFTKLTPNAADLEADGTLESITRADIGTVNFWYGNNTANGLVPVTSGDGQLHDYSWWNSTDHTIYTTGVPSQSTSIWIDLSQTNAFGFSFQMAANMPARGWFKVFYDGPDSPLEQRPIYMSPNPGSSSYTPGFSVANSAGSCQRITRIQVDPDPFVWGIFNMGIDTSGDNCVSVPEPDSLGLIALGLIGLGLVRVNQSRRRQARQYASSP